MRKLVGSSTLDTSLMEINEVVGRAGLGWAAVGSDPDHRITGNQSSSAAAAVILSKHPAEGGSTLTSHFDNP